jgi:magnesium chelatase family protein
MMARALLGILPPLQREEALETTCVHSAAGLLSRGQALMTRRPVRMPHHTASAPALIGGGSIPRPGEVSLAHHGVLFLDETPEFPRPLLETLRQPLEDGIVTIAAGGEFASDETSQREMDRYLARISGPLIDRVDIHVEVPRVAYKQLAAEPVGTDSATMRENVLAARQIQRERTGSALGTNATLRGRELDRLAPLDDACSQLMEQAMTELNLSARAYDKVRRLARTIADVDRADPIQPHHVAEAIQYRLLDRKL